MVRAKKQFRDGGIKARTVRICTTDYPTLGGILYFVRLISRALPCLLTVHATRGHALCLSKLFTPLTRTAIRKRTPSRS